jgi:hypothetical protein
MVAGYCAATTLLPHHVGVATFSDNVPNTGEVSVIDLTVPGGVTNCINPSGRPRDIDGLSG